MGIATTRTLERVAAAVGLLYVVPVEFQCAEDIPNGGVLCALPALLTLGLLRHTSENFTWPKGYYPMESVFLLLAYLALARVPSVEQLRYQTPGEWGKLLGLDRIPEVRTLRQKLVLLGDDAQRTAHWSAQMARDWMQADAEAAGVLLVDGHTRVYHGSLTALPQHYISRERLCLRATTDYWVNALDGAPFFCVTRAIDPGLQQVIEADILPRLLVDVPGQPSPAELEAEPLRHRFTLVFDREGYSPDFFTRLKAQRIAILSYHKFPGKDWAQDEFSEHRVTLQNGEEVMLKLAERGTQLSNGLWVRELRHLEPGGHQTSVLSTDYRSDIVKQAAAMFARWHQENFFKYMREHYGLDRLVAYGVSPLPETTKLVNPAWRKLDGAVRRSAGELVRARAKFSARILEVEEHNPEAAAAHEVKKGAMLDQLQAKEREHERLKVERKAQPRHITLKDLPEADRVAELSAGRKQFMDTIKLIAYRAESALVQIVREKLTRHDDARAFVRGVMHSTVNLRPDVARGELRIELHGQSNPVHDRVLEHLCEQLNETEWIYPDTKLRLRYVTLRSSSHPDIQA